MSKLPIKPCIMLGSFQYSLYCVSMIFATKADRSGSDDVFLLYRPNVITFFILLTSILNGMGAAILWVAIGKYLSDCALICSQHKGFYTSLFFNGLSTSTVAHNILSAVIISYFSETTLFVIMSGITLLCQITFILLP